jgi:hypothetical protein
MLIVDFLLRPHGYFHILNLYGFVRVNKFVYVCVCVSYAPGSEEWKSSEKRDINEQSCGVYLNTNEL